MGSGGFWWVMVGSGGLWWVLVGYGGFWRVLVDSLMLIFYNSSCNFQFSSAEGAK